MDNVQAKLIGPVPTPHWGSQAGAAFTIRATNTIDAPPQSILNTVLDTSIWPRWNNFVPRVSLLNASNDTARLQPGTLFTEHVDMSGRGRSTIVKIRLLMTALDELNEPGRRGYRVVWLGKGYPSWLLRSERVHLIYHVDSKSDSHTTYDVFETFSGPLAWAVKFFVGKTLVERFGQWNKELKGFMEGRSDTK